MTREEIDKTISEMFREGSETWHLMEKKIVYDALKSKYGDEVDDVIAEAIGNRSLNTWKKVAELNGQNSLADFTRLLFGSLPEMGWEFTADEKNDEITYKITKCPKYDLAKELGAEDIMYLLACATDEYIVKGFNENIQFSRTKTLMEGDECCNHCYRLKKPV